MDENPYQAPAPDQPLRVKSPSPNRHVMLWGMAMGAVAGKWLGVALSCGILALMDVPPWPSTPIAIAAILGAGSGMTAGFWFDRWRGA